ncbi:terminase small subunit [Acinetobacter bereziniae]|uniref:terminase small subunit n=1 Tax=Acinetobacter bereziniae TaxID=106648 RepID=UPI0018FF32E5|nr:terminase small subunit [Acinetobacter bereziniae]MBJ8450324.1 terminase small subunit [Acinetobacter bereziniae]MBJ8454641.1 terminase small subunit [Acinetobacter bereziniae]
MSLTAKMRKFAQAVVNGLSNKDAAITAGYAEKTAAQAGAKLAKNPDIISYIEKLKADKKLTSDTQKVKTEKEKVKAENFIEVVSVERIEPEVEQANGQFVGRDDIAIGSIDDPLEYLKTIWTNKDEDPDLRLKAAQAAMPYVHGKVGTKGKKESQKDEARDIAGGAGKFATRAARKRYS